MSVALDRNALKIDLRAVQGAWDDVRRLMRAVSSYVSAVESIDFSPVPVQGAQLDLFFNLPQLRPTLVTARDHARPWVRVGNALWTNVVLGMVAFGSDLKGVTDHITATVKTAAAARRTLTDAERASIVADLRRLEAALGKSTADLTSQQSGVVAFVRAITADATPLQYGAQDLNTAIHAVQQNTTAAALKYLTPDGQGIARLITDWGGKILERLRALQTTLQPLGEANERAQHAVQGMLTVWETVKAKYATVIEVLAETRTSVDTFATLPDLLEVATLSWNDVVEYVKASA